MRLPQHEAEMRSVEFTMLVFVITGTVRPLPIEVHFKFTFFLKYEYFSCDLLIFVGGG